MQIRYPGWNKFESGCCVAEREGGGRGGRSGQQEILAPRQGQESQAGEGGRTDWNPKKGQSQTVSTRIIDPGSIGSADHDPDKGLLVEMEFFDKKKDKKTRESFDPCYSQSFYWRIFKEN